MSLSVKNMLGGGKPEGLYAWKKSEIGSELKEINESVSTLPYTFYRASAVVFNNEIHILGSHYSGNETKHYKWDGTSWTSVSTLPYNFYDGSAVVFNNEIHILGGGGGNYQTAHYKWDGTSWTSVSTLPYTYTFYQGSAVVLNGEIHVLGSNTSPYKQHYKWDGTSWTSVSSLPYNFYRGSAVVLNNEIHILGGNTSPYKQHYKWDGTSWTSVSSLPYNFYRGSAVVFNNEIHILGSGDSSNETKHYKWDGTSWTSVSTLPYGFCYGSAVVFDNGIHILGSYNSNYQTAHYLVYGYVPVYTFLNYIVSDKETAYPDGGEKGGHWYEKVNGISGTDKIILDTANQLIPDAVKALSLVHTEEITPASDSDAILHSYVGTPNHFILTTEDFDWSNQYILAVTNITYLIIGGVAMRKYILSGNKAVEGSASSFINITSTAIMNTQNDYKFIAGHTYKLYVFA